MNEELRMKNEETKQRVKFVWIEIVSETERRIVYDDTGA